MGVEIEEKSGFITCNCDKIIGTDIHLDFPSVGATENIILSATLAQGVTTINNAAMEPEIVDLAKCLNRMGAKVEGAGTNVITITGVRKLKSIGYKIMPDRIEAGTFLCAVAVTGGNARINNVIPEQLTPIIHKLRETGCSIEAGNNFIDIEAPKKLKAVELKTLPYPGFPTDLQPVFGAMLTYAKGTSIIVENIFESRYKYIGELIRMGAKITTEGKTAVITGKRRLVGTNISATDLRGGAGLIVAGLSARGTTVVEDIDYILRGYEKLEEKLTALGANIKRVGD